MSLTNDRQYVICDGEGCGVTAFLPVALRSVLPENRERERLTAIPDTLAAIAREVG